jgi:hypothetical protein
MASIAPDDALILPHRANPRWIGFSGTTAEFPLLRNRGLGPPKPENDDPSIIEPIEPATDAA